MIFFLYAIVLLTSLNRLPYQRARRLTCVSLYLGQQKKI